MQWQSPFFCARAANCCNWKLQGKIIDTTFGVPQPSLELKHKDHSRKKSALLSFYKPGRLEEMS
jgi:hypothetical protein